MRAGALDGIRVLEFSVVVAGPVCGVILSDLGADVVKVEPPGGEPHRRNRAVVPNEGKLFQTFNRGKRSLVVDLGSDEGRALIHRLLPQTDVVVVNYRLGVAKRLGIDYETLRAIRPDLIYVESTGFGTRGRLAASPASDIVAQAYSGLMAGEGKVAEGGEPLALTAGAWADYITGIASAMGVATALYHRDRTGEGQKISGSLLRSAMFAQSHIAMREPISDSVVRDVTMAQINEARARGADYREVVGIRLGSRELGTQFALYYNGYRAKDGGVVLGALTKANRDAMRRVLGLEGENCDDPDYDALDPVNLAEAERWKQVIRDRIAERTVAEWVEAFEAAGTPVSPVNLPEEMSDDPQVVDEGIMVELEHEITGPQRVVGPIIELSETPTRARRASPPVGRHTRELLREFGLPEDEIDALAASGVVAEGA